MTMKRKTVEGLAQVVEDTDKLQGFCKDCGYFVVEVPLKDYSPREIAVVVLRERYAQHAREKHIAGPAFDGSTLADKTPETPFIAVKPRIERLLREMGLQVLSPETFFLEAFVRFPEVGKAIEAAAGVGAPNKRARRNGKGGRAA